MVDITVSKGRHLVTIVPETEEAKDWIKANMTGVYASGEVTVTIEYYEDVIADFRKAGFTLNV